MAPSLDADTVAVMSPETRAALDRLHASGLIAEAIEAVRMDHYYAAEMAHEHNKLERLAAQSKARHAARAALAA